MNNEDIRRQKIEDDIIKEIIADLKLKNKVTSYENVGYNLNRIIKEKNKTLPSLERISLRESENIGRTISPTLSRM